MWHGCVTNLSAISALSILLSMSTPDMAAAQSKPAAIGSHSEPSKRGTPKDLLSLLGKYIDARDLDGIISIHEPNAALVEFGGGLSRGAEELRKSYTNFFKMQPKLKVNALQIVEAGGVAIIIGDYTLGYVDADGEEISSSGKFGDMVRRQPDGSWLYLLDNPFAP